MANLTQKINWKPFSRKHKLYIRNGIKARMSVAEGSVRSGKTIDNVIIAMAYLEVCKDKIHLASGSTMANAKLNIGECNGYGLEHLFRGRCKWGKFKENEALFIKTQTGEKVVIFAGGGKADSYKKILGNSYGLWIATEINEHFDGGDAKSSFVKVAIDRQIASVEPKTLWDLNPSDPKHRIYSDYIDKYLTKFIGGYNYCHFTILDNLSISKERMAQIFNQYEPGSLWFRRNLMGERCVAEGLIYGIVANNPSKFILPTQEIFKTNLMMIQIGVDFGGNKSATAFVATGFKMGLRGFVFLEAERHKDEMSPDVLEQRFVRFVKMVIEKYPNRRQLGIRVRSDNAEPVLMRGLKNAAIRNALPVEVLGAYKTSIIGRVKFFVKAFNLNFCSFLDSAEDARKSFSEARWDDKKPDERLDETNVNNPIDMLDACEYSVEEYIPTMLDILSIKV
jgi:PBSX family phage terminase large subunit